MRTVTTTALLEALNDPANEMVWEAFDARYRPIIFGFARRLGLGVEDAADLAQTTLTDFVRDYREGGYQRERGRLRSWILGIARNRVYAMRRKDAGRRHWRGESAFDEVPESGELSRLWAEESERVIYRRAIEELRATNIQPNTLRAFEMVTLDEVPAEAVASECGMTVAEVYRVKHRVTRTLREIVQRLNEAYEED